MPCSNNNYKLKRLGINYCCLVIDACMYTCTACNNNYPVLCDIVTLCVFFIKFLCLSYSIVAMGDFDSVDLLQMFVSIMNC